MDIIGNGFIARNLRPLSEAHEQVTVLAAGVPRQLLPESETARERALVGETIRRCRRTGRTLVFFSTVSMYGAPGCRGLEDEPVTPSTRYGAHKLGLEDMIRESSVRHLILRLGYVMGPGGPDFRLVPALLQQILSGSVRVLSGARRDLLYVADFVAILDRLLGAGVENQVVNVASGDCVEVIRIIEHLERRLGVTAERIDAGRSVSHCPSVAKLRALVPEISGLGIGPGYYRNALDRYLLATDRWSGVAGHI
ncbi:NAD-dependent epimerase/dehydratase family protein [Streptomyces sp. Li-HN-5-11]|uniref:NAD-dependent epimerase/dehydratase family protein n=1 Tax=Streptomyces sp. Li-HN-5-11 TaxID=3075432 RepID=UPI0028AE839D|nr:NAD-dependent epimerase/dehydratase family protein [Streptomyces sp. Li-HN-5-11]WNM31363.1 NAD-dependent epimerase/dehydratase family protein [Streptomyces sp. Li-HN-5-11]